jgi:hypothetical protein
MTAHEPTEPSKDIDQIPQPFSAEKWSRPESGLEKRFEGVHLGRIGNTAQFKDESRTLVPEAGIVFDVVQNSAGMTGIYAEALEDYTVEALQIDDKTKQLSWDSPHPSSPSVLVSGDWGELVKDDGPIDWSKGGNFGIEGPHGGIVRVTDKNGAVKYYFLGADFKGESDDWLVTGGIVEIHPTDLSALPGNTPVEQPSVEVSSTVSEGPVVESDASELDSSSDRFRPEPVLGQIATRDSDSTEDDLNAEEAAKDAALRARTPQPPLTEADIADLTRRRGRRPSDADIEGMNAARARGIHN